MLDPSQTGEFKARMLKLERQLMEKQERIDELEKIVYQLEQRLLAQSITF
jgi:hypothetical protein